MALLDVSFTVDEVMVAGDSVAHALTRSNGTIVGKDPGVCCPKSCRELFVLGRRDGAWKVGRYMFNQPR